MVQRARARTLFCRINRSYSGSLVLITMSALSKEEYLKRYLNPVESGDYKKRKKKKNDKVKKVRGMKIVDDDISWSSIGPKDDDDDALLTKEEKPQIEVVDNRTKEEKEMDAYRKSNKWKILEREENGKDSDSDGDFDNIPRRRPARHDSNSDMDVPRSSHTRHDSESDSDEPKRSKSSKPLERRRHDSDSDAKVQRPRKTEKDRTRQRYDSSSDSDVKHSRDKGHVRGQRSRKDSDSDLDIPRLNSVRKSESTQKSSERRKSENKIRHDSTSDTDLDLPRSKASSRANDGRKKLLNSNVGVPRSRKQRHDSSSDSDLNIPRSKGRLSTKNDQKLIKRKNSDSDMDLPRVRTSRHGSDADLKLPRRHEKSDGSSKETKKRSQMSSGGAGGLTSRLDLKKELQERKRMETDIDRLAKESSKSETVFRVKGGKKRDLEKERQVKEAEDVEKQKRIDKYAQWGKGIKQTEMKDYALEDLVHETNKPLARYRDDADLDAFQRSRVRDGDPMAEYLAKKKSKETANVPSLPKYRGPPPPLNRYGTQPGYRWDGVDRSNGFEKKFFMKQSERSAQRQEAYKWSVEDM